MPAKTFETRGKPRSIGAATTRRELYLIEIAQSAGGRRSATHWTRSMIPRRAQKAAANLNLPLHELQPPLLDGISNPIFKQAILRAESTVSRAVPARPDPINRRRNA